MQSKWTPILIIPIRLPELAAKPQDSRVKYRSAPPRPPPSPAHCIHPLSRHSPAHSVLSRAILFSLLCILLSTISRVWKGLYFTLHGLCMHTFHMQGTELTLT